MKRQHIVLGKYNYIAELYYADKDYIGEEKNYSILRASDVMNNIIYDNAVFFIEQDIINECREKIYDDNNLEYVLGDKIDTDKLKELITYPITLDTGCTFSSDIERFDQNILSSNILFGRDILPLCSFYYNNKESESVFAKIKCDKLRIYTPSVKSDLNAVICVSSYINNIHFYYLCRPLKHYQVNSDTIFSIANTTYSEYYDIYIPSVDYLFNSSNVYAVENCNINEIQQHFTFSKDEYNVEAYTHIETVRVNNKLVPSLMMNFVANNEFAFYVTINDISTLYMAQTFRIYVYNEKLERVGVTITDILNNLLESNTNASIKFAVYNTNTYWGIDINYVYLYNTSFEFNFGKYATLINVDKFKNVFLPFEISNIISGENLYNDVYISIFDKTEKINSSWLGESENLSIISLKSLTVPFMISEIQNTNGIEFKRVFIDENSSIQNKQVETGVDILIFPYTNIDSDTNLYIEDTNQLSNSDTFVENKEINLQCSFTFNDDYLVARTVFNYKNQHNDVWNIYSDMFNVSYDDYKLFKEEDDEVDIPFETNIKVLGYRVEIATDANFNHLVYKQEEQISLNNILAEETIIDNFDFQLHDIFDNWNTVGPLLLRTIFIDKVTATVLYSNTLVITKEYFKYMVGNNSNKLIDFYKLQSKKDKMSNMDLTTFNFIDKITCVVNKVENNNVSINKNATTPKIIYKPIFYKVASLQNIKIKRGVKQKIGINLSEIMGKVETFKLHIDDIQYTEYARNDVYVLFDINASDLTNISGLYTITNQSDEYISEGSWSIY